PVYTPGFLCFGRPLTTRYARVQGGTSDPRGRTHEGAPKEAAMAKDLGDTIGTAVGRVAREAAQSVTNDVRKSRKGPLGGSRKSPLGGMTGVAAGAALAAGVPLAVKGASKLANGLNGLDGASSPLKSVTDKATDKLGETAKGIVDDKVKDLGGPGG